MEWGGEEEEGGCQNEGASVAFMGDKAQEVRVKEWKGLFGGYLPVIFSK